jgi:hypothetical protein
MADRAPLPVRLARLAAAGPAEVPLAGRVCEAARVLLGADGASVTMGRPAGDRVTLCATDDRSGELEDLQDVLGEGPCQDAFRERRPACSLARASSEGAARWPAFSPAAARILGPDGGLWSFPMCVGSAVIGTLSVYRLAGETLAEPPRAAQALADAAGALLVQDPPDASDTPASGGFGARAVVHLAVGKLVAQLGLTPEDALVVLRSRAFGANAQLAQVARAVLDGTVDLTGR